MKSLITQDRLREVLHYDEHTGLFTWVKSTSSRPVVGQVAGTDNGQGYTSIRIDGRAYLAHRLAWLYIHGAHPVEHIDHRDGRPSNNAFNNLREANRNQNQQNQRPRKGRKFLGVHRLTNCDRYSAVIGVNGKSIRLGLFKTEEEAAAAYLAAKVEYHPFQTLVEVVAK